MQLTQEVKTVLQLSTVTENTLLLPGQLDRKLYMAVNKAVECMGGKWNRKAKCHVFGDDAADVVADAVATGCVVDFKKEFQFYETPEDVTTRLCDLALLTRPKPFAVLEPSAGKGRIADAIRVSGHEPFCCELADKHVEYLVSRGYEIIGRDFLRLDPSRLFDRIVMNPPFTRGQDIAHVTCAYQHLLPTGRLVSIMSPGWKFRQNARTKAFRELLGHAGDWYWFELPAGTFKASGTNVNTGIMVIDRF